MKQKIIGQLIDKSGVLGFGFENDEAMHTWDATRSEGKMLARHTVENCDGNIHTDFYVAHYDDPDACKSIYQRILLDFVGCYAKDLFHGSAGGLGLFSDVASKGDEGLIELLSLFEKTYDGFLLDVFYWYGRWIKAVGLLDNDETEPKKIDQSLEDSIRVVKSVLRHLAEYTIRIENGPEVRTYWKFAVANGGIWYCRYDGVVVDDITLHDEEYGCVSKEDPDGMAALRDAVIGCLPRDCWNIKGDVFGLLGINEDDCF